MRIKDYDGEFHSWECVSLLLRDHTIDFVVKDEGQCMALLNFAGRVAYHQTDSDFLTVFRKLKFKMKLGYECWRQGLRLQDIANKAIEKTLREKRLVVVASIQKYIFAEDGVPTYSQYSRNVKSNQESVTEEQALHKQRIMQLVKQIQQLEFGIRHLDLSNYVRQLTTQGSSEAETYGHAVFNFSIVREQIKALEVVVHKAQKASFFDFFKSLPSFMRTLPMSFQFYTNMRRENMSELPMTMIGILRD